MKVSAYVLVLAVLALSSRVTAQYAVGGDFSEVRGRLGAQVDHDYVRVFFNKAVRQIHKNPGEVLFPGSPCANATKSLVLGDLPHAKDMLDASAHGLPPDWGDFYKCVKIPSSQYCKVQSSNSELASFSILGLCLPDVCHGKDLKSFLHHLGDTISMPLNVTASCGTDMPEKPWSNGSLIFLLLTGAIVLIQVLAGIIYVALFVSQKCEGAPKVEEGDDLETYLLGSEVGGTSVEKKSGIQDKKENDMAFLDNYGALSRFAKLFSPQVAIRNLFKVSPGDLAPLHGLRCLAMAWVVLGHTFYFSLNYTKNPERLTNDISRRFSFGMVLNAAFSVDIFFYLGGFVTAFAIRRRIISGKGWQILGLAHLHRALRILPAYVYMIFFSYLVYPHLNSGPMWGMTGHACQKYWWTNVVFINNWYPSSMYDQCYPWSWYLAVDMQLFLLAPFIVYLYTKAKILGWAATLLCFIASQADSGWIVWRHDYSMNLWSGNKDQGTYPEHIYTNPLTRAAPYCIGMMSAYVYDSMKSARVRLPWYVRYASMCIGLGIVVGCIFGTYTDYSGGPTGKRWPKWLYQSYTASSRSFFALGLSLVFNPMYIRHGGVVRRFFSAAPFHILQKLTFGAYLVHPLVIWFIYGQFAQPLYYTDTMIAMLYCGILVATVAASAVLYIFVEHPFGELECWILRTK